MTDMIETEIRTCNCKKQESKRKQPSEDLKQRKKVLNCLVSVFKKKADMRFSYGSRI